MKIVVAPQALKGSLSARETGLAIVQGVRAVYPQAEIDLVPVADGGEGTLQALVDATGGRWLEREVTGPLGEPVLALSALAGDGQTALIEMAACSGLPLVPLERRDPAHTTTRGLGELILKALDDGCTRFIIGIGGSATNDGGAGMVQALGVRLLDAQGHDLPSGGAALSYLACIDTTHMDSRLASCTFQIACDVTNPLCGPLGASAVYAPQKGASPAMVLQLDAALSHYADIIERDLGRQVRAQPGAGAAGGLGAGFLAFLPASLLPGASIVLETVHLDEHLHGADLVITAEGQLDGQTAYGKSVAAVARLASTYHLPVLVIVGSLGDDYQQLYQLGIAGVMPLATGPLSLQESMSRAAELTSAATERALRIFEAGRSHAQH